ncbi:hypothetical protein BJ170DRAFT_590001 [Xylariales sp. AK1849]|nr:hypothetical protein BJ170DRAFT_590001 [Xylariales sp. AK1849]
MWYRPEEQPRRNRIQRESLDAKRLSSREKFIVIQRKTLGRETRTFSTEAMSTQKVVVFAWYYVVWVIGRVIGCYVMAIVVTLTHGLICHRENVRRAAAIEHRVCG